MVFMVPGGIWQLWDLCLCFVVTPQMPPLIWPFITRVASDNHLNLSVCLSIVISKMGIIRAPGSYGCHEV